MSWLGTKVEAVDVNALTGLAHAFVTAVQEPNGEHCLIITVVSPKAFGQAMEATWPAVDCGHVANNMRPVLSYAGSMGHMRPLL